MTILSIQILLPIMKKTLLALAIGLTWAQAMAAYDYYIVVPVKNRQSPIAVTMQANTLPMGYVNEAFPTTDFKPFALVTGDSNYDATQLALNLKSGALPAGMTFQNGVLSGTPTQVKTNEPLQVEAAYKTKTGTQTYGLTINPGRVVATLNADFYKLPVGYTSARYAYLINNSTADVSGASSISLTGSAIQVNNSLPNECAQLSGGILKAGQKCAIPLVFNPTANTVYTSKLSANTSAGQVTLNFTGEGIPLASTSTVAMSSAYRTNNSLNWVTHWRFEALVDKAREVVTYNAYFTSSCTTVCGPPGGNYVAAFYAPSPIPVTVFSRKIPGVYESNVRLSSSAPLVAGSYRIQADGLSLNFTVSPTYQISDSSLTFNGAAVTSVPITVTNN